jgi:hypothetical protein
VETAWCVLGDADDLGVERVEEVEGVCDAEGCGELWRWRERWDEQGEWGACGEDGLEALARRAETLCGGR